MILIVSGGRPYLSPYLPRGTACLPSSALDFGSLARALAASSLRHTEPCLNPHLHPLRIPPPPHPSQDHARPANMQGKPLMHQSVKAPHHSIGHPKGSIRDPNRSIRKPNRSTRDQNRSIRELNRSIRKPMAAMRVGLRAP